MLTARQVTTWHDTQSFWLRTLALTTDNYVAHENLANLLHERGDNEEALQHVQAVLQIRPQHVVANLLMGEYESSHGNVADAIVHYQTVTTTAEKTWPRLRAYDDLAAAYLRMGEPAKARHALESSLQISPRQPEVITQLGMIAQRGGDLKTAEREYLEIPGHTSNRRGIHPAGPHLAALKAATKRPRRCWIAQLALPRISLSQKGGLPRSWPGIEHRSPQ